MIIIYYLESKVAMKRLRTNILIGLLMTGLVVGVSLLLLWPLAGSFKPGYQPTLLVQLYLFCGIVSTSLGMSYGFCFLVKPRSKWLAFMDGVTWFVVYVVFGLAVGIFNNELSSIYGALSSWFVLIALLCGPWLYVKRHGL